MTIFSKVLGVSKEIVTINVLASSGINSHFMLYGQKIAMHVHFMQRYWTHLMET